MKVYYKDLISAIEVSGVDDVIIVSNDVYITVGNRDISIKINQLVEIKDDEEEIMA